MAPVRTAFLEAADYAVALLRDPSVASHWDQPSALAEISSLAYRTTTFGVSLQARLDPGHPGVVLEQGNRRL